MPDQPQIPSHPFEAFAPSAVQPFDDRWLCHLLRRAAFGPTLELLEKFSGKPLPAVLDWLFEIDLANDPMNPALDQLVGFVSPFSSVEAAQGWWIFRMLNTPQPLQERMALFWHNRFATSALKVQNPIMMHMQIEMFRQMGLKNYRELVVAVGRDPAMLVWLDGQYNRRGKPNENYGRELMELFTLGIGNYTETDVKEMARAFTGWQVRIGEDPSASFNKGNFDAGPKNILGQHGPFDSQTAVDAILKHPMAAKFLAHKMLKEFVHPAPPSEAVDFYAERLVACNWEIAPVLREMLSSRMFFSEWAYRTKIKSPCDLVIGGLLAMGGKANTQFARESMNGMGQMLLLPPNVKGWDGEEIWINANTLIQRYNFGMAVAAQHGKEFARKLDLLDYLRKHNLQTANDVEYHFARLLLDGRMPDDMHDKLLAFLNENPQNKPAEFHLTPESFSIRVRALVHLMMASPEYQLA